MSGFWISLLFEAKSPVRNFIHGILGKKEELILSKGGMEEVCGSKFANWVAARKIGFIDKVYECLVGHSQL